MKNYKLLSHTADLGIEVWGSSMKELFVNAASAMYGLIADIRAVKPVISVNIKAEGLDRDELLKNWLSELLYYFHVKNILFSRFSIQELGEEYVIAGAQGEEIDKKRHGLKHEIKAVTFHRLMIREEKNKFITEIIFDV